jgi:hypothetical protein
MYMIFSSEPILATKNVKRLIHEGALAFLHFKLLVIHCFTVSDMF